MKQQDQQDKKKSFKERYPYFGLLALLIVAFGIIVALSFADGLDLGFIKLKGSRFKEELTREQKVEEVVADTVPEEKPTLVEPDSTVRRIMVFGDSMTWLLANRLADYGEKNGYTVTSITWDGSTTIGWCQSEKLIDNLAEVKPDFIFISLGGNELTVNDLTSRSKYVETLLSNIGDIPLVWVGPPMEAKDTKFEDMIKSMIPEGAYFRTQGMELEIGPDHIHPTRAGAAVLIDSVMRWMPKTPHPILSELPDSTMHGEYTHIYFNTKGERKH